MDHYVCVSVFYQSTRIALFAIQCYVSCVYTMYISLILLVCMLAFSLLYWLIFLMLYMLQYNTSNILFFFSYSLHPWGWRLRAGLCTLGNIMGWGGGLVPPVMMDLGVAPAGVREPSLRFWTRSWAGFKHSLKPGVLDNIGFFLPKRLLWRRGVYGRGSDTPRFDDLGRKTRLRPPTQHLHRL